MSLLADSIRDLRHAARRCARNRGLTIAVVAILALGIGTAAAVASVARRLLLHPIPVPEPERLVVAWEVDPSQDNPLVEVSFPYFREWRAQSRSFEDMAAFGSVSWTRELRLSSEIETVAHWAVSTSFFDTLRARPLHGRVFLPPEDDPGADRVAVLGYDLWQRRFGGDPAVVGASVILSDEPFTIVGIMPRGFDYPRGAQVWTCVGRDLAELHRRESHSPQFQRSLGVLYVVGRLRNGVSPESARAELGGLSRRLSVADGFSEEGWDARLVPLVDHYLGENTRRSLEALGAAGALVLLLACANVSVLLLVQAIARRRDLAVRHVLGASAARLALQPLAESVVLVAGAGVVGALLATATVRVTAAFGPSHLPGLDGMGLDGAAFALAFLCAAMTVGLAAAAPALFAARHAAMPLLKSWSATAGSDGQGWQLSRLLVVSEVALSIVLLVGGGLMVRSLGKLLKVDLGYEPEGALSFSVALAGKFEGHTFHRALIERIAALPDVQAVGAVHNLPLALGPIGSDSWVFPEGHGTDWGAVRARSIKVNWESVTPDYFRAVGTRLVAGRAFSEHDGADTTKVAIVSESVARRCWPGQSALGKRINTWGARWEPAKGIYEWQTVVGVTEDARYRGIEDPWPDVYLPYTQAPNGVRHFVVRTAGAPLALVPAIREQVRAIDPGASLENAGAMSGLVDHALSPWRLAGTLLVGFAMIGLVLTASGLFAVMQQFVARRTRDIAIRIALGAEPGRVRRLILTRALGVAGWGITLGLALSLALARVLAALLYGVGERDPWSHLGAAALLLVVVLLACVPPARRAGAVDPAVALRAQ